MLLTYKCYKFLVNVIHGLHYLLHCCIPWFTFVTWITCYIKGTCYTCSLSYKTSNNKMPTLNLKPQNVLDYQKNTKVNLGFQSKLTSSKGV